MNALSKSLLQRARTCLALFAIAACTHAMADAPAPLPIPNLAIKGGGYVNAAVVQADGKVVIGGYFDEVNGVARSNIARLNTDGSLDTGFAASVNGTVWALALAGTDIFVGGDFTQANSVARGGLARIATDGTLVTSWTLGVTYPSGYPEVRALAISGTSLYIGGQFTSAGASARTNLARVNIGTQAVSATFLPEPNYRVLAIAVDGGNVYAGGAFSFIGGQSINRFARVSFTTGEADPLFSFNPNNEVTAITVSGTNAYVGGLFNNFGGYSRYRIAKVALDTNSIVTGWDSPLSFDVYSILLSGGDIFVGGFYNGFITPATEVHRLSSVDGTAVAGWNVSVVGTSTRAMAFSGANLVVGGRFSSIGPVPAAGVARIDLAGAADATFTPVVAAPGGSVNAMAMQADGKLVAAGDFVTVNGSLRPNAFRMNTDGTLDAAWNPAPAGRVNSVAVDGTGVYLAGLFTSAGGAARINLAKVDLTTGAAVPGFVADPDSEVMKIRVSGPDLFAVGAFSWFSSGYAGRVARLNATTGSIGAGWDWANLGIFNATPYALEIAPGGGSILVGGAFTLVGPLALPYPRKGLVSMQASTGQVDAGWVDPNINGTVYDIATSGGLIYIAGGFNSVGGIGQRCVAALLSNGAKANFTGETGGFFCAGTSLAVTPSAVFLGGSMSAFNGIYFHLVKLSLSGTPDSTFQPQPSGGYQVNALLVDGANLLVGGNFASIGGVARAALASLPPLPTMPGQPNMTDATDSGLYNNDNTTNFVRPTFTGTCANGDTVRLRVAGVPVAPSVACSGNLYSIAPDNAFSDGTYSVSSIASNNAVDSAPSGSITIFIQTSAETSITSGPSGVIVSTSASFDFTSPDPEAAFECRLDAAVFSACFPPQEFTGLAEGSHTFQVRALDLAGNVDASPASRTWTIDYSPPDTTIDSGPTGSVLETSASFTFSSPNGGITFECRLDAAPFGACTSPADYPGLALGSHTFEVKAADAAANVDPTPASRTWTIVAGSSPRSGFNGDARSDVFWRDSTGGLNYQWQMNGLALSGQGYMPSVPSNWIAAGVGDVNGNGIADVLWREAGGLNYVWLMNGLTVATQGYLPTVPNPWIVVGLGDASGDGKADVFWRNPTTGQNYLWVMNGLSITSQGYLPTVAGPDWEAVGVADYSGDGKADVFWRNRATGENYLWIMNGLVIASQGFLTTIASTDWEVVGSPDANADGKADVLWRHKVTGQNYLWVMNGLAIASQGYLPSVADANWKVVGFGDYNGDGKGDVLWRNATTGVNYLWTLNGISVATQGYLPSVAGANWKPVK